LPFWFLDVKAPFERFPVPLGQCVGSDDFIWTLSMNTESKNTPIVMVHGFAAGIAFWVMNLEEISKDRPLYAIDLPGFGRSARPKFNKEAEEIEQQYVDSIERWREMMGIDKMVLLGHSFGGYLSSAYAMRHPEKVEHLILGERRRTEWKIDCEMKRKCDE
jgi:abhydrolase domain-containing protein 4